MTFPTAYVDIEDLVKDWLLTTPVADLVELNGYVQIYMGMPKGDPMPSVILSRVGGAPRNEGGGIPEDTARISFSIWGRNRPQAKQIAKTLVAEVENLAFTGGYTSSNGRLEVAETINWFWFPENEIARYIVDVLFTAITP